MSASYTFSEMNSGDFNASSFVFQLFEYIYASLNVSQRSSVSCDI